MFGVVPRVLWERCCPADERNRIPLALNCLLIRAQGKNILVDTGLGDKLDAKFRDMFAVDRTPPLRESLRQAGLTPDDIHLVINTHLHFDHCGGNTVDEGGTVSAAFKKATYIVQRGEYEDATGANERTRASYRRENFAPLLDLKQWEFLDGDAELLPGLSVTITHGHTRCHQAVRLESEGQVAFYLGDLIPTAAHLPLPYIMGYDLYPLQTLATKRRVLEQAVEEKWLLIFEHDPAIQMGYVKKDVEGKYVLETVQG
jgi:glyoxylase-like metal-dependent hydrolase (beta-lactamase superfamily II)